jgi:hypothetical protein
METIYGIKPIDLNKKTVFVLGAGASKPYGLPLGTELKTSMIASLNDEVFKVILARQGFDQSLINDFSEALPRTYHPTIDVFLEKKTKFRKIGSYVIAHTLLPMENEKMLFPQTNWYEHIYNVLNFTEDIPNTENITFVTLNYDRSLEHFLHKNIQYNCDDNYVKNAETKLSKIKIIHAHGSLGQYPNVKYGANATTGNILSNAAEGIRITSDHLEGSNDFRQAQIEIKDAHNVVFLGFGYDPITLKLLIKDIDLLNKRVVGTAMNIEQGKRKNIESVFKGIIELGSDSMSALDFLRNWLPKTF